MTNITSTYSYMDLLKDNGYVPQVHIDESSLLDSVKGFYSRVSETTSEYSFMDLMKDHGQVPVVQEVSIFDELEESINEFIDEVSDYTIIDLVREKALIAVTVPAPANDNDVYARQAS